MRKLIRFLVPMIGMIFFWRYFRFQSFFGILYPLSFSYDFFGAPIHVSLIFIAELLIAGMICIAARKQIEQVLRTHRMAVLICAAAGSIGAFLALSMQQGDYQLFLAWIPSILVTIGFIANHLAWATFFSADFGAREVFLLIISYLASLAIFPTLGLFFDINQALNLLTPIISGIAWFVSPALGKPDFDQSFSSLKSVGLYVPLFIIFLIAGSAIRGTVDIAKEAAYLRWVLSLIAGLLVFIMFWYFCGKPNPFSGTWSTNISNTYASIEKAVFKSWVILVFLFLLGLFASLILPFGSFGGDVVIIARSFLDFFLLVLLCNLAYHKRISPILLFVICSLFVEAFSWCLSYVVVPLLLHLSGGDLPLQNYIGLVVVFVLFSSVTIILSLIVRKQSEGIDPAVLREVQHGGVSPDIAKRYRLTNREVEIVNLFIQGRSLKKVASILGISQSTAQSHAKSVYRKLGIHSKDELIDTIDKWNSS